MDCILERAFTSFGRSSCEVIMWVASVWLIPDKVECTILVRIYTWRALAYDDSFGKRPNSCLLFGDEPIKLTMNDSFFSESGINSHDGHIEPQEGLGRKHPLNSGVRKDGHILARSNSQRKEGPNEESIDKGISCVFMLEHTCHDNFHAVYVTLFGHITLVKTY